MSGPGRGTMVEETWGVVGSTLARKRNIEIRMSGDGKIKRMPLKKFQSVMDVESRVINGLIVPKELRVLGILLILRVRSSMVQLE